MKLTITFLLLCIWHHGFSQDSNEIKVRPFRCISIVYSLTADADGMPAWKRGISYQQRFKSIPLIWQVSYNRPSFYKTFQSSNIRAVAEEVTDTSFGVIRYEREAYNDFDFRLGISKLNCFSPSLQLLVGAEVIVGYLQIDVKETHEFFLMNEYGGVASDSGPSSNLYATETTEYQTIGTYLKRGLAPYLTMQYNLSENIRLDVGFKLDLSSWYQTNEESFLNGHVSKAFPNKFTNSSTFMLEFGAGYRF